MFYNYSSPQKISMLFVIELVHSDSSTFLLRAPPGAPLSTSSSFSLKPAEIRSVILNWAQPPASLPPYINIENALSAEAIATHDTTGWGLKLLIS